MTAIRSVRSAEGQFVMLSNRAMQDSRLSLQARGLIAFVLSLPPDTPLTAGWIISQVPNGRDSVTSALRELEEHGYYRRVRTQDGAGHWSWEQTVTDDPARLAEHEDHTPETRRMVRPAETTDGYEKLREPYAGNPSDGNGADKRLRRGLKDESQNTCSPGGERDPDALFQAPSPPPAARGSVADRMFVRFWEAYPRKIGKQAARKAFAGALRHGDPGQVVRAAAEFAEASRDTDPRFIPYPATWLNQGRWEDDPDAAAPPPREVDPY